MLAKLLGETTPTQLYSVSAEFAALLPLALCLASVITCDAHVVCLSLSVLAELIGRANQAIAFPFPMDTLAPLALCLAPSVALQACLEPDAQTTHLEPGGVELFLARGALKRFLLLFLCHPLLVSAIHCAVLL